VAWCCDGGRVTQSDDDAVVVEDDSRRKAKVDEHGLWRTKQPTLDSSRVITSTRNIIETSVRPARYGALRRARIDELFHEGKERGDKQEVSSRRLLLLLRA
jgi:hypothetical protein